MASVRINLIVEVCVEEDILCEHDLDYIESKIKQFLYTTQHSVNPHTIIDHDSYKIINTLTKSIKLCEITGIYLICI